MNDLVTGDHDELLKRLAWEVARNVIDHHKNVYPEIFENAPSTFAISMRNSIFNQIESAIKCRNDLDITQWIYKSEAHRKEMRRLKRLQKKAAATAKQGRGVMVTAFDFAKAFENNCPNVRLTKDEREELHRLFLECAIYNRRL